jgi:hypothetical protein
MGPLERARRDGSQPREAVIGSPHDHERIRLAGGEPERLEGVGEIGGVDAEPLAAGIDGHAGRREEAGAVQPCRKTRRW